MKYKVFISSFLKFAAAAGLRWWLRFFVFALLFGGCTVQFQLPPATVNNLPDGGKVDILPDSIPAEYSARPRFYWEQIEQSDSTQSFAVTNGAKDGRWVRGDSMRWHPNGPFVTIGADTVATRAYARSSGGSGGGMTSFDLSADNGANETITDGETLAIQAYNPFNLINSGIQTYTTSNGVEIGWFPASMDTTAVFESTDYLVISKSSGKPYVFGYDLLNEVIQDEIGAMVTGNTETLIAVTYDDANNQFDFVVESNLSNYTNDAGFLTSFNWGSDSGNTSITDGETIRVLGSTNGIDVTGTGNDKTVELDFSELSVELTTDASDYFVLWDSSTGAEEIATSGTVQEWIQDDFGNNVIQAGSNVGVSYSDAAGTITISATDTQLSNEEVQDIVGAMVSGNTESGITVTYDDAGNSLDFVVTSTAIESFDWGSDSGNTTITDGETIRVLGSSNGIDVTGTGNDKTVELDFSELSVELTTDAADYFVLWDSSTGAEEIATSGTVQEWIQDDFGNNVIQAGSNVSVLYSDAGGTITISAIDTDTQLSNEQVQDIVGAMVSGNTESGITVTYDDIGNSLDFVVTSAGITSFDWGSDSGNTSITDGETIRVLGSTNGIDVTGTGNDKTVDLDFLELGAGIGVSTTDDYFIAVSSVGTEKRYQGEEVKDWIGAMVSGNTESGITVTYQAADQTFDFSATDNSATNEAWDIAGDTGSETQITAADGTITFAGGTGISTAYNSTTNTLTISSTGGSGMTSWTWGGDVATTSITDGETVRVQADAGLDAILSGNTVTVSYDFNELSSVGSTPSALDKVLLYDFSTSSYRQMAASGFVSPILEAAGEIRFDNRPSDPTGDQGDVFYDTDDDQLKLYTASGWKLIPIQENEEWGNTGSTTTSASGTVTVSHSLGVSPSYVNAIINPATTGWYTMVSTVTSSNVVFRVTDASGVSCASCSVTLYYHFKK